MENNLISTLQNYGLSQKEAKVYLTLLELGAAPASTIARRSEIKRATVYTLLNELKKNGFVSESITKDVKYYAAISPENLLHHLEQKYEAFKAKVPELMQLTEGFTHKPKVQFFEGIEGIKTMYLDLLCSSEPIYAFMGRENTTPELQSFFDNEFIPKRIQLKIPAKVILSDSKESMKYKKSLNNPKKLTETVTICYPAPQEGIEVNIYWENKVMIAMRSQEELMGLILTSKKFHDTLFNIFNYIWRLHHEKK